MQNELFCFHHDLDVQKKSQPIIQNWLSTLKPDALLLSGGNDIGEYLSRDATEYFLLDWAKDNNIPVLGICRGFQIIAKWAGSELVEMHNHVNIRHSLISKIQDVFPKEVNSYHNWGLMDCPENFIITAQAEDKSIEAIKHINLPWEAWMWHPEREDEFSKKNLNRFMELIHR